MTLVLFKEWVERLNGQMQLQKRNILLLVDNCAAHPDVEVSNVKLVFLPLNTTSRLHHRGAQGALPQAPDPARACRDGRGAHRHRAQQAR